MRASVEDGTLGVAPIAVLMLVARFFHKVPAVTTVVAELKHDWVVPAELLATAHIDLCGVTVGRKGRNKQKLVKRNAVSMN